VDFLIFKLVDLAHFQSKFQIWSSVDSNHSNSIFRSRVMCVLSVSEILIWHYIDLSVMCVLSVVMKML
jgi:hypothetical protein